MLYILSSGTDNIWDIFQGSRLSELLTGLELSFTDGQVVKQMAVSLTFKICFSFHNYLWFIMDQILHFL